MLLCNVWFLDVIEPLLAMMLLCQDYVALMLLCIGSRTFSNGTDVFVHIVLDTLITPEQNGTFSIGVYRKPTHTDLYLPWDSNHHLSAKYSVIKTLTHRAHTVCSTPKHLEAELKHLEEALGNCKYPKWAIKKVFKQHLLRKEKKQQPTTTYNNLQQPTSH